MAEGFIRSLAGSMVDVETAGPFESAIDPYCQWAMNEVGVDLSVLSAEPVDRKNLGAFTHLVLVGEGAAARLGSEPPAGVVVIEWTLPDPGLVRAQPRERIIVYRAVRNRIERRVKALLAELLEAAAS